MKIDEDHTLSRCENSVWKNTPAEDLQHSGIGLDNVKKRLSLLFPDKHQLKIVLSGTAFKVELSIQKERSQS